MELLTNSKANTNKRKVKIKARTTQNADEMKKYLTAIDNKEVNEEPDSRLIEIRLWRLYKFEMLMSKIEL